VGAEFECSQTEFYNTKRVRRQLQALGSRRMA